MTLFRHRKKVLWLNTELCLIRGFQYIPSSVGLEILSFPTNWFTRAIRTNLFHAIAFGQVEIEHAGGRILWIVDLSDLEKSLSADLLDNLAVEAGLRGLHFLTASASKEDYAFKYLSDAGYTPTIWQKIWQCDSDIRAVCPSGFIWKKARPSDLLSINLLQSKLLSHNEKAITPPINKKPPAFILFHDDTLCGYANVMTAQDKVMITPIIDPEKPLYPSVIKNLIRKFFRRLSTYYLVQTSSQQWIETVMGDQILLIQPRQEIMVKYLAVRDKQLVSDYNRSRSNQHTDIVTPLSRID